MLVDKDKFEKLLRECWRRSGGKAWEPSRIKGHPFFDWATEAGYLKVVDGRCGFEKIKDAMVSWTDAGRIAMTAHD